jgi:hypothetical protein
MSVGQALRWFEKLARALLDESKGHVRCERERMEVSVTQGQLFAERNLSIQDQHAFEQWLKGCAVVGAVLSLGLMAMALAGSRTAETEIISRQPHTFSFQELHALAHLEYLPIQHIEDQTLVFAAPPSR